MVTVRESVRAATLWLCMDVGEMILECVCQCSFEQNDEYAHPKLSRGAFHCMCVFYGSQLQSYYNIII